MRDPDRDDEAHFARLLHRRRRPARAAAATAGVLLLIAYGTALALSRTEGFRALVRDRLARQWSGTWEVGRCALTPGLSLVLGDVRARWPEGDGRPAAIEVRRARLEPRWRWPVRAGRIAVEGGRADFRRGADGRWKPEPLAAAAAWLDRPAAFGLDLLSVPATQRPPAAARDAGAAPSTARGGRDPVPRTWQAAAIELRWWEAAVDVPLAEVDGLDLALTPLRASGRDMTHLRLAARRVEQHRGAAVGPVRVEVLLLDGRPPVLIECRVGEAIRPRTLGPEDPAPPFAGSAPAGR